MKSIVYRDVVTMDTSASLNKKLEQLKEVLPNGYSWNWGGDPVKITYGGVSLTTFISKTTLCGNHDGGSLSTCEYITFDKNGIPKCGGGKNYYNQCSGFARLIGWAVTGKDPFRAYCKGKKWEKTVAVKGNITITRDGKDGNPVEYNASNKENDLDWNVDNLKPGDIIRVLNSSKTNGHHAFVTKVDGNTVTVVECNVDGHCNIRWGRTFTKAQLKGDLKQMKKENNKTNRLLLAISKYSEYK